MTPLQLCPPGFKSISISRKDRTGGGIAVVYKDILTVRPKATHNYSSIECGSFSIDPPKSTINMSVIYRPPNSSVPVFATDFLDLIETSINENGKLILGDLNIPMNNPDSADTSIFQAVLDSLGLHNHITFPTHRQCNTLDLIITEHQESFIKKLNQSRLFSDHYLINFEMTSASTSVGHKMSTFRKIKSIDQTAFAKEVQHRLNTKDISKMNNEECIDIYHNILKTTLDNHAQLKSKVTSDRPKLPWYSDEIGEAICRHCKAERVWKNDIRNKDKYLNFYRLRRQVTNLLNESECTYYKNTLHEAKSNSKKCLQFIIHFLEGALLFHYHLDTLIVN